MPRYPRAEAPSRPVGVRLSPLERQRAAEAAQVNRTTVAEFIRDAIVSAAADCLEPLPPDPPRRNS